MRPCAVNVRPSNSDKRARSGGSHEANLTRHRRVHDRYDGAVRIVWVYGWRRHRSFVGLRYEIHSRSGTRSRARADDHRLHGKLQGGDGAGGRRAKGPRASRRSRREDSQSARIQGDTVGQEIDCRSLTTRIRPVVFACDVGVKAKSSYPVDCLPPIVARTARHAVSPARSSCRNSEWLALPPLPADVSTADFGREIRRVEIGEIFAENYLGRCSASRRT